MRNWFIRQSKRPLSGLVFDVYVVGMVALCVVGGWIL